MATAKTLYWGRTPVWFCSWLPLWRWRLFLRLVNYRCKQRHTFALNALWGMPLIFGALGAIIEGLLGLLHYALKKLSIARR